MHTTSIARHQAAPTPTSTPTATRHPGCGLRRRAVRLVAGTIAAAGIVLAAPGVTGTAQAATFPVLDDGFEFSGSLWQFTHSGPGFGGIDNVASEAHAGSKSALLGMFGTGFSSAGRTISLPSSATSCTASAFISPRFSGPHQVNVEVIDPSTFTYVALKEVKYSTKEPYGQQQVSWAKQKNTVLLRFSLLGSLSTTTRARIDDVKVTCS